MLLRKLNSYFDYKREPEYLSIYYIGIRILEIDMKYKVYITNNYHGMFRRITAFLRMATAKLIAKGYRDMDKVRILYDQNKYESVVKNGRQVLVRKPEIILVG